MTTDAAPRATPPDVRPARHPWRARNLVGLTALTAYSTAIGWQAQLVSYPLYRAVGAGDFAAYHQQYNETILLVVSIPGFISFLAGIAFYWTRPDHVRRATAVLVSAAGFTSLLITVLWAIPAHDRLDEIGQSAATIDTLLDANLVRTLALSASTLVLCWCTGRALTESEKCAGPPDAIDRESLT